MRTHVALLRGINVGGNNMLAMTALAKRFSDAGCEDVVTYINSGNVVFRATAALAKKLPAVIAAAIAKHHKLQIPIAVRTAAEVAAVVTANPFLAAKAPVKELYVGFLGTVPDAAAIAQLDPKRSPPDEFRVIGGEIYLRYRNGAGTTKLTNTYIDGKLGTFSTVRNWNTVLKLHELVSGGVMRARLRAGALLYAAIQFVVLTTLAMRLRVGGYDFFSSFLSELGATRTWAGEPNTACAVLFGIALGSLGVAFVAFAGTWRAFAFGRGRARVLGIVGQVIGTISGLAFLGIAVTPVDRALQLHNAFVISAFALLLAYATIMTIVWARNGATRIQLATSIAYVLVVCGYAVAVAIGVRAGVGTERGWTILVVSQKIVVYASMVYIIYLTIAIRDQLRIRRPYSHSP